jgi:hypothetical protein
VSRSDDPRWEDRSNACATVCLDFTAESGGVVSEDPESSAVSGQQKWQSNVSLAEGRRYSLGMAT